MNDRIKFRVIVVGLLVLAGMALAGCGMLRTMVERAAESTGGDAMSADAPSAIEWTIGGDVTVRGVVIENVLDCYVDGTCLLRIETESGLVEAIYHTGRRQCVNAAASESGERIESGDFVEVYGEVIDTAMISTCASETYRITKVS